MDNAKTTPVAAPRTPSSLGSTRRLAQPPRKSTALLLPILAQSSKLSTSVTSLLLSSTPTWKSPSPTRTTNSSTPQLSALLLTVPNQTVSPSSETSTALQFTTMVLISLLSLRSLLSQCSSTSLRTTLNQSSERVVMLSSFSLMTPLPPTIKFSNKLLSNSMVKSCSLPPPPTTVFNKDSLSSLVLMLPLPQQFVSSPQVRT